MVGTAEAVRIRVQNLTFNYGDKGADVFRDVSFDINEGDVISLLGPNGTGKSTLLKCIAGVLDSHGRIFLDGKDVDEMHHNAIAAKIAYVPQTQVSPFPYPVKEIVMMGRASHLGLFSSPGMHDEDICNEAMRRVGIEYLADRPCTRISGGEWQLVLIARAIAQESGILLLDEPTSHLDLGNQMRILETINSLSAAGFTIMVATHFPDHALLTSNRAAILKDGLLSDLLEPEKIITEDMIARTYGVDVKIIQHESLGKRKMIVPMLKEKV